MESKQVDRNLADDKNSLTYKSFDSSCKTNDNYEFVTENILPELIDFLHSSKFRQSRQSFLFDYQSKFKELILDSTNGQSYPHECYHIYELYLQWLDEILQKFASNQNCSIQTLFRCCKDAIDNRFVPLFTEDENQWIVEELLAWMEFDHFVAMMKRDLDYGTNDRIYAPKNLIADPFKERLLDISISSGLKCLEQLKVALPLPVVSLSREIDL